MSTRSPVLARSTAPWIVRTCAGTRIVRDRPEGIVNAGRRLISRTFGPTGGRTLGGAPATATPVTRRPAAAVACRTSSSRPFGRRRLEVRDEFDKGPDAESRAAACEITVVGGRTRRAGDIEVGPRCPRGKRLEEQRRGERATVATAADVLEVGNFGVEHLAVVVGKRQGPHGFAGPIGRRSYLRDPLVVVPHQTRDLLAEGHDACSGERREVDD